MLGLTGSTPVSMKCTERNQKLGHSEPQVSTSCETAPR